MDEKLYESFESFSDIDTETQQLIQKAEEALSLSYSPYSGFTVGAAALLENGEIIKGANQENASYPAGLCAERVVLFQIGAIDPNTLIKSLAVVAKRKDEETFRGAGPCGMCRQVMLEFEHKQKTPIRIIFRDQDGGWIKTNSVATLMPFAFGKENL